MFPVYVKVSENQWVGIVKGLDGCMASAPSFEECEDELAHEFQDRMSAEREMALGLDGVGH